MLKLYLFQVIGTVNDTKTEWSCIEVVIAKDPKQATEMVQRKYSEDAKSNHLEIIKLTSRGKRVEDIYYSQTSISEMITYKGTSQPTVSPRVPGICPACFNSLDMCGCTGFVPKEG